MAHTCHAEGCSVNCRPEYLMCYPHWKRVPKPLQAAVYRHYRAGQCDDMNPSREWMMAAEQAICYVAYLDGQITMKQVVAKLEHVSKLTKIPVPTPVWRPVP